MKSFSQFLSQAYLSEEVPAGMTRDQFNRLPSATRRRLSGNQDAPAFGRQGQQLTAQQTPLAVRGARNAANQAPEISATNDIASRTTQPTVQPNTTTVSGQQIRGNTPAPAAPAAAPSSGGYRNPALSPTSRVQTVGSPVPPPPAAVPPSASGNPNIASRRPGESTEQLAARRQAATQQRMAQPSSSALATRSPVSRAISSIPSTASTTSAIAAPPKGAPAAQGRAFRGAMSGLSGAGALYSASQGDWSGAAEQGLLAAAGSNRLNQGAARLGQRGVQAAATRLGMKGAGQIAARFVPGLQTAYGLYRGTAALNRGDYLGAALGYGSALPVVGGAVALADIARDVVSPYDENKARQDQARSARQSAAKSGQYGARYGSALTGGGGNTFVSQDQKGNTFMSTGGGKNRVTTQLAKTQLVRDPKTGKQVVGDLAFRGGKATYLARPSIASRDTNLWSRFSRWSGIGGQRQADAAAAKKEYRTALANTQRYQKAIKGKK